jgi:hypothetical protein
MSGLGLSLDVHWNTWTAEIDATSSAEGLDRILADVTFNEMLTLGSVFRHHDDFLSPETNVQGF